ncbi:transposase, partial [Selenomonas ruminantium]
EGRSIRSIIEEYGMSKASIINWCNEFREECQNNPESQNEYDSMKEIRKLRKENLFLKKAAAFFAKEID